MGRDSDLDSDLGWFGTSIRIGGRHIEVILRDVLCYFATLNRVVGSVGGKAIPRRSSTTPSTTHTHKG